MENEKTPTFRLGKAVEGHPRFKYFGWDYSSLAGIPKICDEKWGRFLGINWLLSRERVAYLEHFIGKPPILVCETDEIFHHFVQQGMQEHFVLQRI